MFIELQILQSLDKFKYRLILNFLPPPLHISPCLIYVEEKTNQSFPVRQASVHRQGVNDRVKFKVDAQSQEHATQ